MAATYESVGLGTQSTDATSITITAPSGIQDDDLLLALIAFDGFTKSNLAGTGWTYPPFANGDPQSNASQLGLLYKIASSEAGDYTFTWTSNETASGAVMRISGADVDDPLDQFGGFYLTGQGVTTPPVFVRNPGSLLVVAAAKNGTGSGGGNPPLTERVDQNSGVGSGQCHLWAATASPPASSVGSYYPFQTGGFFASTGLSGNAYRTLFSLLVKPAREPGVNFGVVHPGMSGGFRG